MKNKKVYVFNQKGFHLTISFQLWNWLKIWINLGYPRTFIWGTYFGDPKEFRVTRDLSPLLNALDIDTRPIIKLLGRCHGNRKA